MLWMSICVHPYMQYFKVVAVMLQTKPLQVATNIHSICKQSVLPSWYAVDWHMGQPLHCFPLVEVGGDFRMIGVWAS